MPDDGRSISRNVAHLNILVHDVINLAQHDKILMLAKSKLDSTKNLVSQALIDMEISHKEFNAIVREKEKHERMKENVRNVSERSSTKKKYEIE